MNVCVVGISGYQELRYRPNAQTAKALTGEHHVRERTVLMDENQTKTAEEVQADQKPVNAIKNSFTAIANIREDFTQEQLAFVKNTIAPSLNDNEMWLFLYRAQAMGYNPLNGDIYSYSKDKRNEKGVVIGRDFVIIVGKNGKLRRANEMTFNGKPLIRSIDTQAIYVGEIKEKVFVGEHAQEGSDEPVLQYEIITKVDRVEPWAGGKLWGAMTEIVLESKPEQPIKVVVPLSEYDTGKSSWRDKKETMIKKVSLSQALDLAIPQLGGMYDEAEMEQVGEAAGDKKTLEPIKGADEPATDSQKATLKALGVDVPELTENLTKEGAAKMIERQMSQAQKGEITNEPDPTT